MSMKKLFLLGLAVLSFGSMQAKYPATLTALRNFLILISFASNTKKCCKWKMRLRP